MGSIWLHDLPDVIRSGFLEVRCWPGWETRSRSSGGYDALDAVFCHHTASSADPDDDASWMWENAEDRPIGALLLERSGRVTVGAAGATNCQGKGGPLETSVGVIPLDKGNCYGIAIEAANNGVGEPWPPAQLDAYTALVAVLCDAYGLNPVSDVVAHFEWAPDRKIDPAGPDRYAAGSQSWDMGAFRSDVAAWLGEGTDDMALTDEDVQRIANAVWRTKINVAGKDEPANMASVIGWTYAEVASEQTHTAAELEIEP